MDVATRDQVVPEARAEGSGQLTRTPHQHRVIVAAINRSVASRDVVLWAVNEAGIRDAHLRIVSVIEPTPLAPYARRDADELDDRARLARAYCRGLLNSVVGRSAANSSEIEVLLGHPARTLIGESAVADLLVLGSHERGSVTGLGPVNRDCTANAHCPVVVIRAHTFPPADSIQLP